MAKINEMHKLEVGQELWWVPHWSSRSSEPYLVKVESIGRKWVHLDNGHMIDINTLIADGGDFSSPGACFLSEQAYKELCNLKSEWNSY